MSHPIKATDAAIAVYHAALKTYSDHSAAHEGATETAFSRLLNDTGKRVGWTLIPKKGMKVGGKHIAPDGTFQDDDYLVRGYWEAKDVGALPWATIYRPFRAGLPRWRIP